MADFSRSSATACSPARPASSPAPAAASGAAPRMNSPRSARASRWSAASSRSSKRSRARSRTPAAARAATPADIREEERVQRGRARGARRFRPDRFPRQQCGRTVRLAAGEDFRQGLGRRGAHQPDRRLPDGARSLRAMDEAARRRDREHDRRHVERHARHGPFGRRARRHAQLHRDRGARMGAGARQRGRAGLDRVVRARPVSARDARSTSARCRRRCRSAGSAPNRKSPPRSCSCSRPPRRSFPARASASTARCRTSSACADDPRNGATQPFDGFHLATKPKVLE